MKKMIFLMAAVISLSSSVFAQKTVYDKDSTKIVYTKQIETSSMLIEKFYLSGNKMEDGVVNTIGKIGTWTRWFENGTVNSIANFKNGKKHGSWKFYNEEGNLYMELTYRRNKLIDGVKWGPEGLIVIGELANK